MTPDSAAEHGSVSQPLSGNATLPRLRWRRLNRWRAQWGGYFWLPCPVCGEWSGGHEWKHDGLPASVPNPDDLGCSTGICPACTREGYGYPADVAHEIWSANV